MPVYASHAHLYKAAGWPCVFPLPPGQKSPPPPEYTGNEGRDVDVEELARLAHACPDGNVALRMPDGVVGIDVDHYDKVKTLPDGQQVVVEKRGGDVIAELEARLGPLPPTWGSSAREWPTGIRFYRVPPGKYRTTIGDAIEVIQRHHRYAVAWPSTNPDANGARYQWYELRDPASLPVTTPNRVPRLDELPWLPEAWVAFLREGAAGDSTALGPTAEGADMLHALEGDLREPCAESSQAGERALRKLRAASAGSRHDAMAAAVHDVVHVGAKGHPGAGRALRELTEAWDELTAGEWRGHELERALLGSARKAVTLVRSSAPVPLDPCTLIPPVRPISANGAPPVVEGRPAAEAGEGTPAVARAPWSVRQVIGAHPFDPRADLDQLLAEAMLERLYPALRHASDVGGWLIRRADRWELTTTDMTPWMVSLLANYMPLGDPGADEDSDEYRRYARRKRLMSAGPASAFAKKIRSLVAAHGEHPAAVRLTDLDADPDVLWAGGVPWNLRRAEPAQWIAPDVPHLHACAVMPAEVPTPRWDAFLRAVLPDDEVRAWALRVLGVALTGHADRALPILWGDKARGKTQLVKLVMSLLGSYAHAADPRLLSNPDGTHASIVFALRGRRLSFIDEGPRRGEQATERLKQVTGGGELTGNPMRGNPVSFAPTHTLVLTSNEPPGITDEALRDRVRLIPCEGDPGEVFRARAAVTGEAWQQEAPGVLLALMRESAAWLAEPGSAHNDASPTRVRAMVDEIAAEQDPVAQWLGEAVAPHEQGTRASELYQSFVAWCRGMGYRNAPNTTRWGRALSLAGYPAEHRRDGKYRQLAPRGPGGWGGRVSNLPGWVADSNVSDTGSNQTSVDQGKRGAVTSPPGSPGTGAPGAQFVIDTSPTERRFNVAESGGTAVVPPRSNERDGLSDESVHGFEGNPSQAVLPGQPPLSPSSVTSVTSHNRPIEEREEEEDQVHIHRRESRELPVTPCTPATKPGVTCENAESEVVTEPVTPSRPPTRSRSRLTPEEKAARAEERRRIKAAEREMKRRTAVDAASGPVIGLPAVVQLGEPCPSTVAEAAQVLTKIIQERGALSVDVEHSGYPVGHELHALRTVQLGDEHAAVVLDATDPAQRELAAVALAAAPVLRAFAAAADLVPLAHAGLVDADDAWRRMLDVVVPAKLDSPAGVQNGSDLKATAVRYLADPQSPHADAAREALFKAGDWQEAPDPDTPLGKSGWAQVDHARRTMVLYDAADVLDCAGLARALPPVPTEILERERRVEHVVSRIAHVGLPLDRAHVEELIPREEAALAAARERLMTRGVDNGKSPKQVGEWLTRHGVVLPLTDNGNPSTAEGVLENRRHVMAEDDPAREFIADVLDYREHATSLGLFLRPWHELCARGDGRTRSTIYTLGAATGRMSSVRFNLQQITREGGYRACILADPGYLLVSADFTSVEVRCMAALSSDATLRELIARSEAWEAAEHAPHERNPYDLHNVVAEMAFGPEWTKRDRYMVKRGVFGWAYGGSVPTLAAQVGCGESIMGVIVDSLATIAPDYVRWSDEVKKMVRRGAVEFPTYSGRVIKLDRRFPHKAPNYLIQGTARELLVDALLRWDDGPHGGGVVVPVHDEILAMVPAGQAEAATAELVRCMRTELHGVPIAVGAGEPSAYWRDAA